MPHARHSEQQQLGLLLAVAGALTRIGGDAPPQIAEAPLSKQLPQLFQLRVRRIVAREARRMLEVRDDRLKRSVLELRCTKVAQMIIGFFMEPLRERDGHSRFAYPRLAGEQHGLAFSLLCTLLSTHQKFQLLARPTSGIGEDARSASNRLTTALGRSTCQADTAPVKPRASTAPRSRYSNNPPMSRRVFSSIRMVFGSARFALDPSLEEDGFELSVPGCETAIGAASRHGGPSWLLGYGSGSVGDRRFEAISLQR